MNALLETAQATLYPWVVGAILLTFGAAFFLLMAGAIIENLTRPRMREDKELAALQRAEGEGV